MVGNATLTIVRSTIVIKNETASTANARQRWIGVVDSVVISVSYASAGSCGEHSRPGMQVLIWRAAGIHR
jgi:hypothetical protein